MHMGSAPWRVQGAAPALPTRAAIWYNNGSIPDQLAHLLSASEDSMTLTHGFELLREQQVPEINALARFYRHVQTGAELLSLITDDENKVFGITFRTPPDDSSGVAHILEHSVLCGSRKYPVKEPFVVLLKSSLKTFLNAFTYPDKTCYPVASTNLQDFYNLVDVYLDAVFFPRITPEILQQEGWHYELTSADAPMIYKGVVFNEMKGAYSSPDSVLYRYAQQSLFPDTTYGVSSGGDPKAIPDLTYEAFKRFHETLYHPSNARIWFYGDDDPTERLRLLDVYLSEFERIEPSSDIALQEPFAAPVRVDAQYAASSDSPGKKGYMMLGWMLGEPRDTQTTLALDMLDYILLGNAAAPLRKALIDSGLGEEVVGGYTDSLRQHTFAVGMKGIDPADAERVQTLILDTLAALARDGIDPETIAAALNTAEFSLRENNTGSFPRGLALMIRSLSTWLYDGDPLAPLAYEAPLAAIRAAAAQGGYFESFIRELLLENIHRSLVVLQPDETLAERDAAEERAKLDAARAAMDETDVERVIRTTLELKRIQETPDDPADVARIPMLTRGDLEREIKTIPTEEIAEAGVRTFYHDLFTNGIVYLTVAFDLHTLPQELLPYVPLFGRALTEMGTTKENFVKIQQRIGRDTGGISAGPFTATVRGSRDATAWLMVGGKATVGQSKQLLDLVQDLLLNVQLDNRERFKQIVLRAKANRESSLIPSGHSYVNGRLGARFSSADWIAEQMGGVSALFFVRWLVDEIERDWPAVYARLEAVRQHLINRRFALVNATLDGDDRGVFAPQLAEFLASLPNTSATHATWTPERRTLPEGLTMPAQVNYVGKGANIYALGYELKGSVAAITRLLRTGYLWQEIRVQGGAYGAFSSFDQNAGTFSFLSYRDPNLLRTFDVYDRAGDFLRKVDLDADELSRNIIGAIGDLDGYQLPDAKGTTAFVRHLTGVSDESRQQFRDELLNTTPDDFHAFADVLDTLRDNGEVVVLGSPDAIKAAQERFPTMETTKLM
jgi:hypothetical protein